VSESGVGQITQLNLPNARLPGSFSRRRTEAPTPDTPKLFSRSAAEDDRAPTEERSCVKDAGFCSMGVSCDKLRSRPVRLTFS